MTRRLLLPALLLCLPGQGALASDLLNQPPPCVAPADLPSGSADLDPARESSTGMAPADLARPPGIDLDVPLYLPPSEGLPGPGAGAGGMAGAATAEPRINDLVQAGTPVGGVAIRDGKAVSTQLLGREQLTSGATASPPACVR